MTGRGLFIVSALASRWGIDDLPGGTRVWADFAARAARTPTNSHSPCVSATPPRRTRRSSRPRSSSCSGCPPDLLLAHDDNLADIARELRLYGASHRRPRGPRRSQSRSRVRPALRPVLGRRPGGRQAGGARRRPPGRRRDRHRPGGADAARRRPAAGGPAGRGDGRGGSADDDAGGRAVQEWRDWVEVEMVEQATTGRAPVPYADHRAPV